VKQAHSEIKAGAIKIGAIKAGAIKAGAIKAGAIKAGAIKAGAIKAGFFWVQDAFLQGPKQIITILAFSEYIRILDDFQQNFDSILHSFSRTF